MRFMSLAAAIVAGLGLVAAVPSGAHADTTFTLVTAGTLPAGNYGTVNVSSINNNTLQVSVTLSGTNHFANTGIDAGFAFNLNGFGTITVSSISTPGTTAVWSPLNTSGGTTTAGTVHMDGAGDFQYALSFVYPGNPNPPGNTDGNSLTFNIAATNLGLNTANVTGVAADICLTAPNANNNCTGTNSTGAVFGTPSAVPSPIMGAGLPGLVAACAGLLVFARRRRQKFA